MPAGRLRRAVRQILRRQRFAAGGNLRPLPTRRYVALGIRLRAATADDPETQAYPALLRDRMQSYSEVEYANYAVDGQTSAGLLELLSSGGAPMLDGADVVTVCIGANNLLGPTIGLLSEQLRRAGAGYAVAAAQVLRGDHRR